MASDPALTTTMESAAAKLLGRPPGIDVAARRASLRGAAYLNRVINWRGYSCSHRSDGGDLWIRSATPTDDSSLEMQDGVVALNFGGLQLAFPAYDQARRN